MEKKFEIKLPYNEVIILDGKVSTETQLIIDKIKEEYGFGFSFPVMNEILLKSKELGMIKWVSRPIRSCSYCDKSYSYKKYPRNSTNHRKGDNNLDKPIYYNGIKFNEGFIIVKGYGDMCYECMKKNHVLEDLIDYIINNDLKIQIQKNDYRITKYIKDPISICPQCNEKIKESEMGELHSMMGGKYKGVCPRCNYKSTITSSNFKSTDEFEFILNPAFGQEIVVSEIKKMITEFNDKNEFDLNLSLFESCNKNYKYIVEIKNTKHSKYALAFDIAQRKYIEENNWDYSYNKEQFGSFIEKLKEFGYVKFKSK